MFSNSRKGSTKGQVTASDSSRRHFSLMVETGRIAVSSEPREVCPEAVAQSGSFEAGPEAAVEVASRSRTLIVAMDVKSSPAPEVGEDG